MHVPVGVTMPGMKFRSCMRAAAHSGSPGGAKLPEPASVSGDIRFGASAPVKFVFSKQPLSSVAADVVIVPMFQTSTAAMLQQPMLADLNTHSGGYLGKVLKKEGFNGKNGSLQSVTLRQSDGLFAERLIFLGLGDKAKLQPHQWDRLIENALQDTSLKSVAVVLPESTGNVSAQDSLRYLTHAVARATYRTSEAHKPAVDLKKVTILQADSAEPLTKEAFNQAVKEGQVVAEAVSYAKDLANVPYMVFPGNGGFNVRRMVKEAQKLARQYPETLSLEIRDEAWIQKSMPAFAAVANASLKTDPPRFIKLTYRPVNAKNPKRVTVIGKSILYDTGGVQNKGDGMFNMSKDKTGGVFSLAILKALAELAPQHLELTVYLPVTPNLTGPDGFLPDSLVHTPSGKHVRIGHTDSEGRLTLLDSVTQAAKAKNKPDLIMTLATLTGAASSACGRHPALLMKPEYKAIQDKIVDASNREGEFFEILPVRDEDFEGIRVGDDNADIINVTPEKRRAQGAAAFVMNGLPDGVEIPIAHFDMAGILEAFPDGPASGIGVRSLIRFLLNNV